MTTLATPASSPNPNRLKWFLGGVALVASIAILFALMRLASRSNTITLKASGLSFIHTELRVRPGLPVTLKLVNVDGYAHAFDLDELDIHVQLPAQQTATVTFTPAEPGEYHFYCGVYGHRQGGMVGVLVVEP